MPDKIAPEIETTLDRDRLHRLLGPSALKRLLDRLRKRYEQGNESGAAVLLTEVTEAEHRAVAALLGRPVGRGDSLRVVPAEIEATLRRCGAAGNLRAALEVVGGPLFNRRTERLQARAAWEELYVFYREEAHSLGLGEWLDSLRTTGLLKRLAGGDASQGQQLLRQTFTIAKRLPAPGITLSRLAAETLGDAHALDPGRPTATLVCRAITHNSRLPLEESPEGVRELWASAGVLVGGAVTSTVLVLNLPARLENVTGRTLAACAAVAEPVWLTLRQLLRAPPAFYGAGADIFICENPAVLAEAAEELGPAAPPLVCTSGQRNSAVVTLLRLLQAAGARLHYHGDFDRDGIVIANGIIGQFGARPWHFGTDDYRRAASASSLRLTSEPPAALWDPDLAPAMTETGFAVHEEQVLAELLADLRRHVL